MKLRVLSLNVWGLPWPVARHVSRRMQAIGAALPGLAPDVAAFQEVWTQGTRAALVAAGREIGLVHVWHRPQARGGSGLLVLSRLPIASARFEPYDLGGLPQRIDHGDWFGGKGFVEIALASDAGEIALVNTHLQAGYAPRRFDRYVGHRTAQVIELAVRLRELRQPLVAVGDFNFQDMYEEHAVLTGLSGVRDAAAALDRREDTVLRSSPYRLERRSSSERIDYVFTRDGRERAVAPRAIRRVLDAPFEIDGEAATFSDHAGLLAEIEIAPGGAPAPAVDPVAIETARRLIGEGLEAARGRRTEQRFAGGAALLAALYAGRRAPIARRRFLRASFFGGAALAAASGLGAFGLSEAFAPDELAAYADCLRRLEALAPEATSLAPSF